jgi:diacylglycerol O-acyltransferase / trehalose O-mycolyltransferase / mycolyltransferase Ag85
MKSIEGIGDVFGAVAGLSMGGLGAMLYAAHSPHLFRAAASFSGVLDTRGTTDWQFPPEAWGNRTQQAKVWRQHNPTDRAADLRGISLFVSYGNGDPGPLDVAGTATSGVWPYWQRELHRALPGIMRALQP